MLPDEVPKRILHAQIMHERRRREVAQFAKVTSPLGTQASRQFRLLGETRAARRCRRTRTRASRSSTWLRRPDNPFFAKAIVNRVWAHYFGRGIVDPPDDLSPFNPPTHPELLDELCRRFVASGYDLKWLHRDDPHQPHLPAEPACATADNAMRPGELRVLLSAAAAGRGAARRANQATGDAEKTWT